MQEDGPPKRAVDCEAPTSASIPPDVSADLSVPSPTNANTPSPIKTSIKAGVNILNSPEWSVDVIKTTKRFGSFSDLEIILLAYALHV